MKVFASILWIAGSIYAIVRMFESPVILDKWAAIILIIAISLSVITAVYHMGKTSQ